ncbi:MAG: PD-(D/E)XK nuclease family protein [Acidobacteriota bacterium]|nr:PD-(D/E)XK nuclease family protein [Acidobacteriota bacterium]
MPPGIVEHGEAWVESIPIEVPVRRSKVYIRGRFDTVIKLDDHTYGIIDFKTSSRRDEHLAGYSRQLHAYMLALENPAEGRLGLSPITRLGLLVFEPNAFSGSGNGTMASLDGEFTWLELPIDVPAFMEFLSEVLSIVEQPQPPPDSPDCQHCRLLAR